MVQAQTNTLNPLPHRNTQQSNRGIIERKMWEGRELNLDPDLSSPCTKAHFLTVYFFLPVIIPQRPTPRTACIGARNRWRGASLPDKLTIARRRTLDYPRKLQCTYTLRRQLRNVHGFSRDLINLPYLSQRLFVCRFYNLSIKHN